MLNHRKVVKKQSIEHHFKILIEYLIILKCIHLSIKL